jgi:hypothetical protein
MILGNLHRQRQFAGAMHLSRWRFTQCCCPGTPFPRQPLKSFEPPCHHASAAGDNAKTPQPAKPRTHCPICNGFAALHLAVPAPASALLVRPAVQAAIVHTVEDGVVGVTARTPQNRGPPSPST